MKTIILLFNAVVVSLLAISVSGCSMGLGLTVPKDVSYAIRPGYKRPDLIAILGQPQKSTMFSPPRRAPSLPEAWPAAKVSLCDEYKVSGLLLTPGEATAYDNQWGMYPVVLMVTGGASEAFMLPFTAGDLTLRSLRRYRLRLWYDRSQRLVSYDKH